MASEETPVIQGFLTEVFQTVNPKKEYASLASKIGGSEMSRYDDLFQRAASARGRSPPGINAAHWFSDNANIGGSEAAWTSIQNDRAATAAGVQTMSGHSPSEWADMFGFDVSVDWPRYRNMSFEEMTLDIEARYPPRNSTTPGNTPGNTPASAASTVSATKSTSGSPTADKLMGETKAGPGDGATVEERAALAQKAAKEINDKAATEEGMSAWQKLAKRMKNNPKKTALLAKGAAALVVVATIVGIALNRYLASDGAEIEFTSIKTHPEGLLDYLVNPTDVDCQWKPRKTGPKALPTVPLSDIRVLEGDGVTFHDAQLPKVEAHTDGVAPTGVADPKKEFSVSTETGDSSDIDYKNKGWGVVHTSFAAHFAATVEDLVDDFASALNKARKQFFPDFTSLLNGILVVIALIVGVMAIGAIVSGVYSLSKSGSTSNTG
jgi:hypothetical protein